MATQRLNRHHSQIDDNIEEFRLIWLDTNINETDDSIQEQNMFLQLNSATRFYTDPDRCIDFIKSIKGERALLIISKDLARTVLSQTHCLREVVAVFIFDTNGQSDASLANEFEKVVQISTDRDSLLKSLKQTIDLLRQQTIAFSLFDRAQRTSRDITKDTASFRWYEMLLHVLEQMPKDEQSEQDMVDKCEAYCRFDNKQKSLIERFRREFSQETAIEWYREDCFLHKLLNRALRTEDFQLLYLFRFVIINLHKAIEKRKMNISESMTTYRG